MRILKNFLGILVLTRPDRAEDLRKDVLEALLHELMRAADEREPVLPHESLHDVTAKELK